MHFGNPIFLLLLLVIPMIILFEISDRSPSIRLPFPTLRFIRNIPKPPSLKLRFVPLLLRSLTIFCLVIALARPQLGKTRTEIVSSGVDIFLALDTSGSMHALDFEIEGKRENRLEVSKRVVSEFIDKRPSDRIGLVVFGSEAYTQCPLTLDHSALQSFLNEIHIGDAGEETAIGSALATSVKRLQTVKAKSKIIILLTDGENNAGRVSPSEAAKAAAALGIKIYTIAVGTNNPVPYPITDPFTGRQQLVMQRFPVNLEALQNIAKESAGEAFQATDTEQLKSIYQTIDKMEKTEVKMKEYSQYTEIYHWFVLCGIISLLAEVILRGTRLSKIP